MPLARRAVVALVAWLPALAGCRAPDPGEAARHIVMYDGHGAPVDLEDRWGGALFSYDTLSEPAYEAHVEQVLDGLRAHVADTGSHDVLLFIHGGLNEQPETIQRAIDLSDDILADGAYPIFLNWQSNLVSSWFAHLLYVRQGRDWGSWGVLVSPFYLLTDLARSLFRFPVVAGHQVAEGLGAVGALELTDRTHARDAARELMREEAQAGEEPDAPLMKLDLPRAVQGFQGRTSGAADLSWSDAGPALRYAVTLPFKPVSIFTVDAAGTGSWQLMRRRVELMFLREDELASFGPDVGGHPGTGRRLTGLTYFLDRLAALQDELDLRITVVGHSMGTIVMNRLLAASDLHGHLHAHGQGADAHGHGHEHAAMPEHAPFRMPVYARVVYLAAACSLRDYESSAFPYMLHQPDALLFHVVLDPDDELDEANAFDLAPRGSLLVWVDDFLAQPSTPMDRTAGRYDNLMVALPNTPHAMRSRVHVRVLPRDDPGLPTAHGQFTDPEQTGGGFRFWDPDSWWAHWEDGRPVPPSRFRIDPEAFLPTAPRLEPAAPPPAE